jgi:hypothetical protein
MRPISVSIASMDVFSVVLGFYGLYLVGRIIPLIRQRFRTERSRQMIMTRPRTVARLEENRRLVKRVVERKNQDPVIYWEARLREPFTYFQRGQLRQRSTIAPGTMRLNRKQALALEAFLQNRNALLAYLEPKGEASAYLTPGPPLLSWRSMITGLALVFFPLLLAFLLPLPVLTVVCTLLSASMFEAWMGPNYVTEIHPYLMSASPFGEVTFTPKTPEERVELNSREGLPISEKQKEKITQRRW